VMGPSAPRTNTRVLAVGAFHAGNDGIPRFAAHAWPAVIGAVPGARLDVVGSVRAGAPGPGVAFVGEVDDLSDWYRSAAVVVCPVEVGSGVKIKMIEALRYGKAVVAMSAAVDGLPPANEPAWVEARTIDECAEATASLLSRPDDRVALELRAQAYAARHFSPERIDGDLDAALASNRRTRRLLTRAAAAMR
jgi:glycosyltransferase involved in cell wall biosynthesis